MKSINRPLKVIETTDDTLTLEGYVAIYGDEQHKDFDGEYFHEGTVFDSGYTKINGLLVDWEHGQAPDMDEEGHELNQPGRHDPLGMLDWITARKDDVGLLARAVLNRREWYVRELVEPLAMAGMLGGSSEAIPGKVIKTGGRIDQWPLMRYALTVTPADPRQITEHQITLVKSLATRYPTLIPPGYPNNTTEIKVHSGDNVSIKPKNEPGNVATIPATPQEGDRLQAASAPATATPEDRAGDDELTPEQVQAIGMAIETLIATIKEQGL